MTDRHTQTDRATDRYCTVVRHLAAAETNKANGCRSDAGSSGEPCHLTITSENQLITAIRLDRCLPQYGDDRRKLFLDNRRRTCSFKQWHYQYYYFNCSKPADSISWKILMFVYKQSWGFSSLSQWFPCTEDLAAGAGECIGDEVENIDWR